MEHKVLANPLVLLRRNRKSALDTSAFDESESSEGEKKKKADKEAWMILFILFPLYTESLMVFMDIYGYASRDVDFSPVSDLHRSSYSDWPGLLNKISKYP